MFFQQHRDVLLRTSRWFTEGIAMNFFHFRQICIFSGWKEAETSSFQLYPFIHNHLQAVWKLKEEVKKLPVWGDNPPLTPMSAYPERRVLECQKEPLFNLKRKMKLFYMLLCHLDYCE
jgi:hypothetical protein